VIKAEIPQISNTSKAPTSKNSQSRRRGKYNFSMPLYFTPKRDSP
jgi:hypothetical protein